MVQVQTSVDETWKNNKKKMEGDMEKKDRYDRYTLKAEHAKLRNLLYVILFVVVFLTTTKKKLHFI